MQRGRYRSSAIRTHLYLFAGQHPVHGISPRHLSVLCAHIHKSLWCTSSTQWKERETEFIFQDLNTDSYLVCRPNAETSLSDIIISVTTTAALILAHILSRRDNWSLFSFSLAARHYSFGQSGTLLSKPPAKHYQRQDNDASNPD